METFKIHSILKSFQKSFLRSKIIFIPFLTWLASPEERKQIRFRVDRWRFRGHSPAARRSQAKANSNPPPSATPSIAAMVGEGNNAARLLKQIEQSLQMDKHI